MKFAAKHRPLFGWSCTASTMTATSSGPIILQCKDPGRVSCLTCQWHGEVETQSGPGWTTMTMSEPVAQQVV
jgi:hypothetical protein